MATEPTSGMVLISQGIYRLLLQLYPRRFREEWGLHMSRTFRDHSRERYRREGIPSLIGLWMFTAMDVCKTALEERAQTGEWFMPKETVSRLGGPSMILAGVLWMVANLGHVPMEWFGGIDFDPVWRVVFPPLLIGLYGLTIYAGRSYLMRTGAWVAVASAVLAYLAVLRGTEREGMLQLWMGSLLFLMLGVLLFGIGALREKPLPRWNGVALLMIAPPAVAGLFLLIGSIFFGYQAPGPHTTPDTALLLGLAGYFGLIGLCLLLLGFAMLPPKRRAVPAPA